MPGKITQFEPKNSPPDRMARDWPTIGGRDFTGDSENRYHLPRICGSSLCIFPRYTPSFAMFEHAYRLMDGVRALMPPQGLLVIAAALPASWEVRLIDENRSVCRPVWRAVATAGSTRARRRRKRRTEAAMTSRRPRRTAKETRR